MKTKYSTSLSVFLMFLFSSCSIIDWSSQRNQEKFNQFFTLHQDSIVYTYQTDLIYGMDDELVYPIPFTITLPLGIDYYYYENSNEFVF